MTHDLVAALCWGVIGSVMVVAAGVTAMIMVAERSDTIGWRRDPCEYLED